jgi:hypothetical protein
MTVSPTHADARVLIVDDDGQIRQLLAGFPKDNGLEVVLARAQIALIIIGSVSLALIRSLAVLWWSGSITSRLSAKARRWRFISPILWTAR